MKIRRSLLSIAFVIFLLLIAKAAGSYVTPTDYFHLYENGKKVLDNSVMISYDSNIDVCKKGRFPKDQTMTVIVTFYKTAEPKLMNISSWIEHLVQNKHKACTPEVQAKARKVSEAFSNLHWRKSPEYKAIQEKARKSKTREEGKNIWKEWEAMQRSELASHSINPECSFYRPKRPGESFRKVYLAPKKEEALYKVKFTIQSPAETRIQNNIVGPNRCFNIDIELKTVEQKPCDHKFFGEYSRQ